MPRLFPSVRSGSLYLSGHYQHGVIAGAVPYWLLNGYFHDVAKVVVQNDLTLKIIDSGESFFPFPPLLKKAFQHGVSLMFVMLADLPARLSSDASFDSVDEDGLLCVFR
ncbi:hypothetical protein [Ensifer adhaerens]|uniref:Uncharacterized protein n=1 Tax=Ensifer adhaerens TaxID=106592 RepID=A0A9Q8YFF8_ENSAD|nr:hypothetical protein [Ensifer adhaerens]USJ27723.1 hypothetical protein NE863_27850 [Ensifer adhaerens]